MAEQYKIIHPIKYYRDYLNHNIRPDCRDLEKFRPVVLNIDSIKTADGSAIAKIGNTTVVCGIKAELAQPKSAEPENGYIVPNIELTPLCSPKFRPGAPSEEAQIYSRLLSDLITNSGCINPSDLCIVKDKLVWVLYCDMTCLDHDGCVLDAALIALVAALKNLKLPMIEYDYDTHVYKVNEEVKNNIPMKSIPIATSFMIFDDNVIITDPNAEEEHLSTTLVTVAICDGEICLVHKPGGSALTSEQLETCLKQSLQRETSIKQLLETVLKEK